MPRPDDSASPTAAGASSTSGTGSDPGSQPSAPTNTSPAPARITIQLRAAQPNRHRRPMSSASTPIGRKTQPMGGAPNGPVSKRKMAPSESGRPPSEEVPTNACQPPVTRLTLHGRCRIRAVREPPNRHAEQAGRAADLADEQAPDHEGHRDGGHDHQRERHHHGRQRGDDAEQQDALHDRPLGHARARIAADRAERRQPASP